MYKTSQACPRKQVAQQRNLCRGGGGIWLAVGKFLGFGWVMSLRLRGRVPRLKKSRGQGFRLEFLIIADNNDVQGETLFVARLAFTDLLFRSGKELGTPFIT